MIEIRDYIARPKPNGYKSLHVILEIPVFLSTGPVPVIVEVQIRTIAMDFWASLEHKIFYKFDGEVPEHLVQELAEAAATRGDGPADGAAAHPHPRPGGPRQRDERLGPGNRRCAARAAVGAVPQRP